MSLCFKECDTTPRAPGKVPPRPDGLQLPATAHANRGNRSPDPSEEHSIFGHQLPSK